MIKKYPKIQSFKQAIKAFSYLYKYNMPEVEYIGTVKLHGCNSSIVVDRFDRFTYQSRNRVLKAHDEEYSSKEDNYNFVGQMQSHEEGVLQIINAVRECVCSVNYSIILYGEWCGEGIQKGVALSKVSKRFIIFDIFIKTGEDSGFFMDKREINGLKHNVDLIQYITDFPHYTMMIDMANPKLSQNELVNLTLAVEKECPVGKQLGVTGIGEGIVWSPVDIDYDDTDYTFKVKGEKHSVSKVKTLAEVDPVKLAAVKDFVDYTVTEPRLEQGVEYLKEMQIPYDKSSTGAFLKWLFADIMSEEKDTYEASGLERKDIGRAVADRGRFWYINQVDELGS